MPPRTADELAAALDHVRSSPKQVGTVELIVRRPRVGEREVVDRAELDVAVGLVGDSWGTRKSRRSADGAANPDEQVTLMNARAIAAIAGDREQWPLAGDQLYVDFDLGGEAQGDIVPEPGGDGGDGGGDGGDDVPCRETDNGEAVCPEPEGPSCDTKDGVVDLDSAPANADDSDGKVTFCHATSSATNKFVVITTSIKACKAHEEHTKLPKGGMKDVFPTGGCAD